MCAFEPTPEDPQSNWPDDADTFDRVYDTVLGITEPTAYTEIAEIADCSNNAAKKHLDRLAEMGIVRADAESRPSRYERDDGYLEFQEASRIARNHTVEEIVDRVEALDEERERYAERFEATDPTAVSVRDDDHDAVHERMTAVSDWQAVERELRLYELAGQLARNDGRLVRA